MEKELLLYEGKNGLSIEDILDGMYDWVRVLDRNDNIVYANRSMCDSFKITLVGQKCYSITGKTAACENCISRQAVFDGKPHEKEEFIDGRIFSVMSSPVKTRDGETMAVVEVLRDVTQVRMLQKKIKDQNKKLNYELDIAKKLQRRLLPKNNMTLGNTGFSYIYIPCESLAGDFVDIYKIDDTHTGVYIADVSGHGVPASMLTVFLRSSINKKALSPSEALRSLYDEFNTNNLDHNLYITVFYAIIDEAGKTITYSNAGHNVCPVIYSNNRFDILMSPGIPISNWLENPAYTDRVDSFAEGDRLFLYTDGIVELKNGSGEQYGEKRLLDILLNDPSTLDVVLQKISSSAFKFADIQDQEKIPDDITIALVEMLCDDKG